MIHENKNIAGTLKVLFGILAYAMAIFSLKTFVEPQKSEALVMVFLSLFLEAFPFILLGAILASLLHIYISEEALCRLMPKNKVVGVITSAFLGFFIPICECAVIPVIASLHKKKVPPAMLVTFLLSAPIVNPLVIWSTYYAFSDQPSIIFARVMLGLVISISIGLLFLMYGDKDVAREVKTKSCSHGCEHEHTASKFSIVYHSYSI